MTQCSCELEWRKIPVSGKSKNWRESQSFENGLFQLRLQFPPHNSKFPCWIATTWRYIQSRLESNLYYFVAYNNYVHYTALHVMKCMSNSTHFPLHGSVQYHERCTILKGEASMHKQYMQIEWMENDFRNLTAKVCANLDNPIKSYDFSKFWLISCMPPSHEALC